MNQSTAKNPDPALNFETALKELELLVDQLESGDLSLAEALSRFERGVALSRECHDLLAQARLKVTLLSHPEDQASEQVFGAAEGD